MNRFFALVRLCMFAAALAFVAQGAAAPVLAHPGEHCHAPAHAAPAGQHAHAEHGHAAAPSLTSIDEIAAPRDAPTLSSCCTGQTACTLPTGCATGPLRHSARLAPFLAPAPVLRGLALRPPHSPPRSIV
ncbi:MAG: hypothetical protein KGL46_08920 [Hyphomicrobiales bacterium]|nr:hypothetical protein [Hyphomicrobiales bacterium]